MSVRTPFTLPSDYFQKWLALARWSIEHEHGPCCRYALMFALGLRRSALASKDHVKHVRPRIWQVETPTCTSQRVSLFDDALTQALLDKVEGTANMATPLYPNAPCGSHRVDDWAHGLAKRKLFRGHTNFQALSVDFSVDAGPSWTPQEIFLASLGVMRATFLMDAKDELQLLMNQLGLATPKSCYYHANWFPISGAIGTFRLVLKDGEMHVLPLADQEGASMHAPGV